MATLLNAVTSDGAGTGASHTGACTVIIHGDSVFDGATVEIQIANTDTGADYAPVGRDTMFRSAGAASIDGKGTYFLRAVVSKAGSNTSITCVTTQ